MPTITKDKRNAWSRMFSRVDTLMAEDVERIARETADRFFRSILTKQPVGKDDPLVEAGLSSRPLRPSVRHGTVPIGQGWLGGPQVTRSSPKTVDIILSSESAHVKYYTMMTGRRWLGTTGSDVTATQADFLHFMHGGQVWKVMKGRSVSPGGFTPSSDFIKDSWDEASAFAMKTLGQSTRITLLKVREQI